MAFDDVELYKIVGGSRSGNNLAPNPGFESAGNWTETRESRFPGTSFLRSTWGTASPHEGSYGYAVSNQAYGYLDSGLITIQPNTQYDLSAWVRGELDGEDSAGQWLIKAYYYDGSTHVAMRTGRSTLNYLLGDHPSWALGTGLGSTAVTTVGSGVESAEIRYYPWGGDRYSAYTTYTNRQ